MNEYLINEEPYIRASHFLSAVKKNAEEKGSGLLKNLNPLDAKLTSGELFVLSPISGGGTQHLLTGETKKVKGVTNFDGNRLGRGRNFVANAITVLYGEAESETNLYNVEYTKDLPAVLLASELIVRQNNEVIAKLPIRSIELAKKSDRFYRELGAFALIAEESEIEVSLELPSGSTITTDGSKKPFVAVYIKGFETYLKR